jgi:hypothetical protein
MGAPAALGPAYAVMQTVDSPEGRLNYLYVVPDLDIGQLDPSRAREFGGSTRILAFGGQIFVADAETLVIGRFDVDADLNLVPSGEVSLANLGISYIDSLGTFINAERAYYMNSEQLEIVVWNPTTMEITGSIDISSLANPAFGQFEMREGTIVGDKLFANYYNSDWDAGLDESAATVAVLSTTENVLLDALRDERCGSAWYGSLLPNGDFVVPGTSWGGSARFYIQPPPPQNCLLRIRSGESTFDPDFLLSLDEVTAPLVDGATFTYAAEVGGAVVWAREPGEFADADTYYTDTVWRPRFVDVESWSSRTMDEGLRSEGWFGETFIVDGAPHFPDGTALVRYAGSQATPRFQHDAGWLQLVQRIR